MGRKYNKENCAKSNCTFFNNAKLQQCRCILDKLKNLRCKVASHGENKIHKHCIALN